MNPIIKILKYFEIKDMDYKYNDEFNIKNIKKTLVLKKDDKDERDYKASDKFKVTALPSYVDLRKWANSVRNQLSCSSCTGFGFGAAYEIMKNQMSGKNEWDTSELFIYYNERYIENTINDDAGATLRSGCKALFDNGSSLEFYWPYIINKFKEKPGWIPYLAGKLTRIESYHRCTTKDEIKTALSQGIPVVSGMKVYNNYFSYKGGIYKTISGTYSGNHCQTVIGYDDSLKSFIIRNSWSSNWGMKGYSYIDYDLFMKLSFDNWFIIPKGWKTKV